MKVTLSKGLQRLFQVTTWVSLFFVFLMIALPTWKLWPLLVTQQTIPLHYNTYFGVDVLGPWYRIFYPALLGLIVLGANRAFAKQLAVTEWLLSISFSLGTILVEVAFFAGVVFAVLVNL